MRHMATRIINTLIHAFNTTNKLPRQDILSELDVFDPQIKDTIQEYVSWMVRQILIMVRRKKTDLLDKKPGAIYAG